ncbi:MAG TPA: FliH/SctL family protein [Terracidiphilus sp.]|nr:FliH/SctL family protein [Terracidiphilus sp.]
MPSASAVKIEAFEYPSGPEPRAPDWEGILPPDPGNGPAHAGAADPARDKRADEQASARVVQVSEEETRQIFEAGRQQGFETGRSLEREAHAEARGKYAAQAVEWLSRFDQERHRYFSTVEHEVVGLALGIAARVLRREAQMDPLLLTGAVRVALGQLSATTQARLRVPAADFALWTETLAHLPNLALKPTLIADARMQTGECVLETELGSVDLGMRAQLTEIERGFFDKAAAPRPAGDAASLQQAEARGGAA